MISILQWMSLNRAKNRYRDAEAEGRAEGRDSLSWAASDGLID